MSRFLIASADDHRPISGRTCLGKLWLVDDDEVVTADDAAKCHPSAERVVVIEEFEVRRLTRFRGVMADDE